jgi:hypothetical protein
MKIVYLERARQAHSALILSAAAPGVGYRAGLPRANSRKRHALPLGGSLPLEAIE